MPQQWALCSKDQRACAFHVPPPPPHDLLVPAVETVSSKAATSPSVMQPESAPILKKWRGTKAMDLINEIHGAARRLQDNMARSLSMEAQQDADAYVLRYPSADRDNVKKIIDTRLREICDKDG
jgi:D-aminopeptidase